MIYHGRARDDRDRIRMTRDARGRGVHGFRGYVFLYSLMCSNATSKISFT